MELEGRDGVRDVRDRPLQAGEDPGVLDRLRVGRDGRQRHALGHAQQHEARRVEELVRELLALQHLLVGEAHVLRGGHGEQAEAHRVGAVLVDQVERVDARAQRLGHPAPVAGEDRRVDVDVRERHVAGELQPEHDHPRDPQEEDVARRGEHVGRVEGAQLGRVVRPAQRGERPQAGGEPRVQHVGIALPALPLRRLEPDVGLLAAVPDGDLVPPPELARDAPRADVGQPLEVAAALALGVDPDAPVLHRGDRGRGELVHAHEPLQGDERLDALAGAVRVRDVVRVGLRAHEPALLAQRGHHRLARLQRGEAGEALAGGLGHAAVLADDDDLLEPVRAADLEVVRVVPGRDLQRARAELRLHVGVGDDGQPAADERQLRRLPHEPRVALVVGMDGDRRVGQHRLRAHRGDRERPVARGRAGSRRSTACP